MKIQENLNDAISKSNCQITKEKKMQKYNVYSRVTRVNLDDLGSKKVSDLVPLIIELNILVQDLGMRLKSYGDNKLDELDEACGNTKARKIFSFIDAFINNDGNVFSDDYYKQELRSKLTDFMFEALEEAEKIAKCNADAAASSQDSKPSEPVYLISENEKLRIAIKNCGKDCLHTIGVQSIVYKGDKK